MSKKLCIDPGHGMSNTKHGVYDPGATSGEWTEAAIILQLALTIKWYFAQKGETIYLTRADDHTDDPVGGRNELAEGHGCTHFIALHCNAADAQSAHGTEAYYRNDSKMAREIMDLAVAAFKTNSRGIHSEGHSQHTRLAVMDFKGHVCLLEVGFITNQEDRDAMLNRDMRIDFAKRLYEWWEKQ